MEEQIPTQPGTRVYHNPNRKRKKRKKPVLIIISVLLLAVLAFAAWKLIGTFTNQYGRIDARDALTTAQSNREAMKAYEPQSPEDTAKIAKAAKEVNGNIVAWVCLNDTEISYPVFLGSDNGYYAGHDVDEKATDAGSVFLDYRCSTHFTDYNNILYGNNLAQNLMFGTLPEYRDEAYFTAHDTGTLYTADEVYTIRLFACLEVKGTESPAYTTAIATQAQKDSFLSDIQEHAAIFRQPELSEDSQLITLSTTPGVGKKQVVLVGTLVRQ